MPGKRQKVMQDQNGIWLSATLACQRTGLKRADLYDIAQAGTIRHQGENPHGNPAWFHEADITAYVRSRAANTPDASSKPPAKPKRKPTDAQIEAKHTREWKKAVERDRNLYSRNLGLTGGRSAGPTGGVSAHLERVMLHEIEEANRRKKADS